MVQILYANKLVLKEISENSSHCGKFGVSLLDILKNLIPAHVYEIIIIVEGNKHLFKKIKYYPQEVFD